MLPCRLVKLCAAKTEDLLLSTARQLLLYEALGLKAPNYYHAPLLCDINGRRLAKRDQSRTLRDLRAAGYSPNNLRLSEDWRSGLEVKNNT